MSAIEITGMTKTFAGKRRTSIHALHEMTLTVSEGEIFGFLGPNGAGKSTTIKCLMGLIRPTSGSASIMCEPIGSVGARFKVGYLPENPSFYDYLSAKEYLNTVGKVFKMPETKLARRVEETLKLLELWDARNRPMRGYSKGMVQRVGLAQTLIHDPDVYILDEPMSGLDPLGRALVKEIICDLKQQGKTVFFSTHIIDDVEKVCDRVGIILKGELQCVARVDQIITEGITGYQVRSRMPGREDYHDHEVVKEGLTELLDRLRAGGEEILLVEPRRRHLEDFFLSIVREHTNA